MFSQDAEHPLIGSTRMSQNVLLWEVRETAGRVLLKEREPGKSFLGGRRKLGKGGQGGHGESSETNGLFKEIPAQQEILACLSVPMKKFTVS